MLSNSQIAQKTKLEVTQKNKFWNAIKFFHTRKPTVLSFRTMECSKKFAVKKNEFLGFQKRVL